MCGSCPLWKNTCEGGEAATESCVYTLIDALDIQTSKSKKISNSIWTIVWIDENDVDHYVRGDFAEDVKRIIEENKLGEDVNVLIFPPDTELGVSDFMKQYMNK
jgi:hypothetical protein